MRVTLSPEQAVVSAGTPVVLTVAITNTNDIISGHQVRVLGVDPSWVHVSDPTLSLFPGSTGVAIITLTLPAGLLAGTRQVSVQVRELTGSGQTELLALSLELPVVQTVQTRMEPSSITAGKRTSFVMLVSNTGNAEVNAVVHGTDEEQQVRFRFAPDRLDLAPGAHAVVEVDVKSKRHFAGAVAVRALEVTLVDPDQPAREPFSTTGMSFLQRPLLSRGALSLGGLLAAVTVFALVITFALSSLVGKGSADRDLALAVAAANQKVPAAGTSALTGTVRLLTAGTPVPGVTVELLAASDTASVLGSAATGADGTYKLASVAAGTYKLRFRGAGFAELWYPSSLTDADATNIDVQSGATKTDLDVRLGGLPASISGTVTGGDPAGAQVTVLLPGTATSNADGSVVSTVTQPSVPSTPTASVVQSVKVAADGLFTLTGIPSPGVYDLAVTKPGFASRVEPIDVGGGEKRTGITLELLKGDGLLSGTVRGEDGPLGGATLSARYGTTTLVTVSDAGTGALPAGSFVLHALPTPQTLTLVVSAPGHASQTLALSLAAGQQLTGLSITLGGSAGSVSGLAQVIGGASPSGVNVLLTDGALTLQTVTASPTAGSPVKPGAWILGGLPLPGTYTVTFSRIDLVPQTLSVTLDPFGKLVGNSDLSVILSSATVDLAGQVDVLDEKGQVPTPRIAADVTIVLASDTSTYQVKAATSPVASPGGWRLDHVQPGTYTLTASARGSQPTSTIVHFDQGARPSPASLHLTLDAPAAVTVTVTTPDGSHKVSGAVIKLYLSSGYPSTPLATLTTDTDGLAHFTGLDAPQRYIAEYSPANSGPVSSSTFPLAPSQDFLVTFGANQ